VGEPRVPVPVRERRISVNGQPVTYKVAGSGEPVVLVHGLAGSMRWWANTVPALAARYSVYLVDLPGFGSMSRFPGGFALKEAASWLQAWLQTLGLSGVHLVGHSMGGYICLRVAARNPQAVGCLALIDPVGVPSGRSTLGQIWPLVQECLLSSADLLPVLLHDAMRAGPLTLWQAARDLLAQDVRDELHAVQAPTLLIWGAKDALVPPSLGYVLRQEIPHSRLLTIKASRHVPMIDTPQELNRALLQFLSGSPVGE
jgi:pimeloyl-ACP methyl ester carboxylesterase